MTSHKEWYGGPRNGDSRRCHIELMCQLLRSVSVSSYTLHMSQDCRKKTVTMVMAIGKAPAVYKDASPSVSMQFSYLALTNHILVFWVATILTSDLIG